MQPKDWDVHINVLGWLFIIGNGLLLVLAVISLFFLSGIGLLSGDETAFPILTLIGSVGAAFFTILAVPGLLAGYGLLKRAKWARVLALVLGFFNLFNFPIGTAIGIYTFWVLLQTDIDNYFAPLKTG